MVAQAFDHTVWGSGFNDQVISKSIHALAVQRIDHHLIATGQRLKQTTVGQPDHVIGPKNLFLWHIVATRHAVIIHARQFMDAVVQCTAQRDVYFLNAAADAKHRHARGNAGFDER